MLITDKTPVMEIQEMTDFDKKLIDKANTFSPRDYRDVDILISIADSAEGRLRLSYVRGELYDLMCETI